MDLNYVPKTKPLEPYINEDGYYPQCIRCLNEIDIHNKVCPFCMQTIDWSWSKKVIKIQDEESKNE